MHFLLRVLSITFFIFLTFSDAEAGKETQLDISEVPGALLVRAKGLVPDAVFSAAGIEIEADGTKVYEIRGVLEDGRKVEVDLLENGKVQEIEIEYTVDQVPGAVMNAIESKYPGFEPTFIEASHSASKKVLKYEFVGVQNGKELDLEVSANGRKIVQADK